jgi:SAM-dependent methyltransferase
VTGGEHVLGDGAAAERLLRAAADRDGSGPLPWAAEPFDATSRVLDLCCGAGPLADELPGRWLGVDAAPVRAGRRPRLRAVPAALPLRRNAVDGIAVLLALPVLPDLDAVFAELRRVLRPGGTLVVLVPSAVPRSLAELRVAPLLAPVHRAGWPTRSALDRAGWLLAAADFAVLGDDRVSFTLPLPAGAATADLVTELCSTGLWPPDLPAAVRARVATGLTRRAGPGRTLPLPLRRLVARR